MSDGNYRSMSSIKTKYKIQERAYYRFIKTLENQGFEFEKIHVDGVINSGKIRLKNPVILPKKSYFKDKELTL